MRVLLPWNKSNSNNRASDQQQHQHEPNDNDDDDDDSYSSCSSSPSPFDSPCPSPPAASSPSHQQPQQRDNTEEGATTHLGSSSSSSSNSNKRKRELIEEESEVVVVVAAAPAAAAAQLELAQSANSSSSSTAAAAVAPPPRKNNPLHKPSDADAQQRSHCYWDSKPAARPSTAASTAASSAAATAIGAMTSGGGGSGSGTSNHNAQHARRISHQRRRDQSPSSSSYSASSSSYLDLDAAYSDGPGQGSVSSPAPSRRPQQQPTQQQAQLQMELRYHDGPLRQQQEEDHRRYHRREPSDDDDDDYIALPLLYENEPPVENAQEVGSALNCDKKNSSSSSSSSTTSSSSPVPRDGSGGASAATGTTDDLRDGPPPPAPRPASATSATAGASKSSDRERHGADPVAAMYPGDGYYKNDDDSKDDDDDDGDYENREGAFVRGLRSRGLEIVEQEGDGNCLFRAVALQVYGDAAAHSEVRRLVCDFMAKDRQHFALFVDDENFDSYIARKRQDGVHGNSPELQAVCELFNRPLEVYTPDSGPERPINVFQDQYKTGDAPIRLSYHDRNHYNAVIDPLEPTAGLGLGLPGLKPGLADKLQLGRAKAESDAIQDEAELRRIVEESTLEYQRSVDDDLQRALKESAFSMDHMYKDKALILSDLDATNFELEQTALEDSMLAFAAEQGRKQRARTTTGTGPQSSLAPSSSLYRSRRWGRDEDHNPSYSLAYPPASDHLAASCQASEIPAVAAAAASAAASSWSDSSSANHPQQPPTALHDAMEYPETVQELVVNGFELSKVVHAYELIGDSFDDLLAFLICQQERA